MRIALFFLCLLCISISLRADDWSLEIVPTDVSHKGDTIRCDSATPAFFVILTNKSNHDLVIWKEWCSWGWFNLTFEVTRADGRGFTLQKGGRGWMFNTPDPYLVKPNCHYVWAVTLAKPDWEGFPKDWKDGELVTFRAIFENKKDSAAGSDKVNNPLKLPPEMWIGKVVSEPITVNLFKNTSTD